MLPVAIMLWYSFPSTLNRLRAPQLSSDLRPVMAYIEKNRQPNDILYVYYGSTPAFLYYAPRYDLDSGNIVIQPDEVSKQKGHDNFFVGIENLAGHDRVWVILSDIVDCDGCDGDMLDYFADSLHAYGTILDEVRAVNDAGGFLVDLNQ
jgi:hypothetical protein